MGKANAFPICKDEVCAVKRMIPLILALLLLTALVGSWPGDLTGVEAARALADGSARSYWEQQTDRLEVLRDPAVADVYLEPITVRPPLLDNGDITADPLDWKNNGLRIFYHKNSVVLIE